MTPPLDALRFDTADWSAVRGDATTRGWDNPLGDRMVHTVAVGRQDLPALGDPTAVVAANTARGFGGRCETLAVERRTAGGLGVVVQVARLPQEPTGWTYLGAVVVPFETFSHTVVVEAKEIGMTGTREMLEAMLAHTRPGAPVAAADLDRLMPAHPKARVLAYLDEVVASLAATPELLAARPWPPADLMTLGGTRLLLRAGALVRELDGRVMMRVPLAAVRTARGRARPHPVPVAVTVALLGAAATAWYGLGGWLAAVGVGAAGLLALASLWFWWLGEIVVETRAGVLRWTTFDPGWMAAGFAEVVAARASEEASCPPSS